MSVERRWWLLAAVFAAAMLAYQVMVVGKGGSVAFLVMLFASYQAGKGEGSEWP